MEALTDTKTIAALESLIAKGIFDAKSISSILHGAGAKTKEALGDLFKKWEKFERMAKKFLPSTIATALNGKAKYLGQAIDDLYAAVEQELDGETIIPTDARITIAAYSQAAGRARTPKKGK